MSGDFPYQDYGFLTDMPSHMHDRLMPHVLELAGQIGRGVRVLDVGCGNGSTAAEFLRRGCQVVGVDLSASGIAVARKAYPRARFEVLAADEHLLENLGEEAFDIVVSTEVAEHLYDPRAYARGCLGALRPGGRFVCSTPYHGYLKNLLLAVLGKWDSHVSPLWDGGHIKLWSRNSLSQLLAEVGFVELRFRGAQPFPLPLDVDGHVWTKAVVVI